MAVRLAYKTCTLEAMMGRSSALGQRLGQSLVFAPRERSRIDSLQLQAWICGPRCLCCPDRGGGVCSARQRLDHKSRFSTGTETTATATLASFNSNSLLYNIGFLVFEPLHLVLRAFNLRRAAVSQTMSSSRCLRRLTVSTNALSKPSTPLCRNGPTLKSSRNSLPLSNGAKALYSTYLRSSALNNSSLQSVCESPSETVRHAAYRPGPLAT